MKILFGTDTKRLPDETNFPHLLTLVSDAFQLDIKMMIRDNFKFYYLDQDGDIISVTNQLDLDEAFKEMSLGKVKLVLARDIDQARQAIGNSELCKTEMLNQSFYSQSSATGQFANIGPKMHNDMLNRLKSIGGQPNFKEEIPNFLVPLTERKATTQIDKDWLKDDPKECLESFFEDKQLMSLPKESHSIACGEDSVRPTHTQTIDARDMVKELKVQKVYENSFGCNTEGVNTSDKMVGAIMQTNECGSQAQTTNKDAMCHTKINTES